MLSYRNAVARGGAAGAYAPPFSKKTKPKKTQKTISFIE